MTEEEMLFYVYWARSTDLEATIHVTVAAWHVNASV
jgi:hypothetical protein